MHYFRNSEVARLYNVSQTAVGKWVEQAKKGKLDLKLIEIEGKSYIASTTKNRDVIQSMVQARKKYFNNRSHKVLKPSKEFYALFSPDQIRDISENLEIHREIPRQYNYIGKGAKNWDEHVLRGYKDQGASSPLLRSITHLSVNRSLFDDILENYEHVNLIDVGPGNALPVKEFIEYLLSKKKLAKYVAVDISADMLAIAERNIKQWFKNEVTFEADLRDISFERFGDLLAKEHLGEAADKTLNLIAMLGGTLGNFRRAEEVMRTVYGSMGHDDILIYNHLKLGTELNKRIFDFGEVSTASALPVTYSSVFDLLNLDDSLYEVETGYDEGHEWRYVRVRLKTSIIIEFEFPHGLRRVSIPKDDSILVSHYKHQTALDITLQFVNNDFNIIQSSLTRDQESLLLICDIKTDH